MITSTNRITTHNSRPFYRFTQKGPEIFAHKVGQAVHEAVNIKSVWPNVYAEADLDISSSSTMVSFTLKSNKAMFSTQISSFDSYCIARTLKELDIGSSSKILDIGAYNNAFNKSLEENGYSNTLGIDVDSTINTEPKTRHINFRDLELNEIFHMIHFSCLLDHLPGGIFNMGTNPSLELFASKLYSHLSPNGYIFFRDSNIVNRNNLESILRDYGLIKKSDPYIFHGYWYKP